MGWDYSAKLVYGVTVEIPENTECADTFVNELCRKHGIKYSVFSYYGTEQTYILHDEDMDFSEGYGANIITKPNMLIYTTKLKAALAELDIKAVPQWHLGISVW